jgi:hypothetical protein
LGEGTKTITATAAVDQIPGVPVSLSFTVANAQDSSKTTSVPETTLMPVAEEFVPQTGTEYTVGYADRYGAASLKAGDNPPAWYYVEDTGLRRLFNAVYTPNAPGSPLDGMGDGKTAIAYTETVSGQVLDLFKIIPGDDRSDDRVEIRGSGLPEAGDAGSNSQIVIDIGLPASSGGNTGIAPEEDNSGLPPFSIPAGALGSTGGDYAHIRLRVNWGVSLVIQAEGSPYGNLTKGAVEVMPRGKLRSAASGGFPLGKGGLIIARNGSAVGMGDDGWFIGPSGSDAAILWDGGDQTGNYLEIQEDRLAFSVSITVKKSLALKYKVWFVNGPTLTIAAEDDLNGKKGLFATEGAKFYGTASTSGGLHTGNPASTILIKPGNTISGSFVDTGEEFITAGGSDAIVIRNQGSAGSAGRHDYREGGAIWGYPNWKIIP